MLVHRWHMVVGCAAVCAALACASTSPGPVRAASAAPAPSRLDSGPAPDPTGLTFAVEPGDAEVVIDGRSFGPVQGLERGAVALQPGLYQVALRRSGYATWRAEVAVRAGLEPIRVTLTRKP